MKSAKPLMIQSYAFFPVPLRVSLISPKLRAVNTSSWIITGCGLFYWRHWTLAYNVSSGNSFQFEQVMNNYSLEDKGKDKCSPFMLLSAQRFRNSTSDQPLSDDSGTKTMFLKPYILIERVEKPLIDDVRLYGSSIGPGKKLEALASILDFIVCGG